MAENAKSETFGGEPVGPDGRYRVFGDQRLAAFDARGLEAYRAIDTQHPDYAVCALSSELALPQRQRVLQSLLTQSVPGLINPLAAGVAPVGGDGRLKNIVVLERPDGGTLAETGPITAQELHGHILPPLLDALEALAARDLSHRAIRPDNIYFLGKERQSPVLGQCVAGLPGAAQPSIYEPLERAAALPEGRGEGTIIGDYYALGVTIAGLLSGNDPAKVEDNYRRRVENGSYATIVGRLRFSPMIDGLLQGLLNDDQGLRWGVEQVRRWRNNTWGRPRPWVGDRQAPRPFVFLGREFRQPRLLAHEFGDKVREAAAAIREQGFDIWVRHSLADTTASERIRTALSRDAAADPGYQDSEAELVARVCHVLDPLGPVRFRDLCVMRDGIGPLMATILAEGDRERTRSVAALLASPVLTEQAGFLPSEPQGLPQPVAASLRTIVREPALGGGLERCLYELNQHLGCLSPLVEGAAETLNDLPVALDKAAAAAETPRHLLDRHVAGFLAARSRHFERRLVEIGRTEKTPLKQALTMVHLLAEMQRYHRPVPMHALCAWAASTLVPVIKAIHSASLRQRLLDEMPGLAVKGDIAHLLSRMKLTELTERDEAAFGNAKRMHQNLAAAIAAIDQGGGARAAKAATWGQWLATMIAFGLLLAGLTSVFGHFIA
ncbi:MAG TPA: hypothetical protein VMU42_06340 [Candidatus Sulfotelmatobacter sp.]|nr:hypothetical protein [Candidatus Sulfotelmatobacter sp.]